MPVTDTIPDVFAAIIDLADALGVRDINKLPGCWEYDVDEHWHIAVNGHGVPTDGGKEDGMREPYSMNVWWNGWLAGTVDAAGGVIAAGEAANEQSLLQAVRAAIDKANAPMHG